MDFLEGLIYVIWRGIAIGIIISAPMGPVGILCVQRTLEKGRHIGFFTGIGAALSDLFYCLLTGFGLSFIEDFLKANQNVIQIVGSVVLVLFGVYLFRSNPARTLRKPEENRPSKGKNVLSGFLFTFSNPLIIFLIIGLFARFNFLLPELTFLHYIAGYVFIFVGALIWWWIVTFFIDKVRSHFNLRSMWLINKITGGIIMIFALVGIITAVTGLARAATPQTVYYNSSRGFGPLGETDAPGAPLRIGGSDSDTVVRFIPLSNGADYSLSFRCAHVGRKGAWGLVLPGDSANSRISFSEADDRFDPLSAVALNVVLDEGRDTRRGASIASGVELYGAQNAVRIICREGVASLSVGNRKYNPVFTDISPARCDSIGIWVAPGGAIDMDNVVLSVMPSPDDMKSRCLSHFADADVRRSYFARSTDPTEGVWEMFDRSLEETMLQPGGNYRLAVVAAGSGYELIYLGGARVLPDRWAPGMTKGRLTRTAFKNVYDVEWLDPESRPLPGEIKAQFATPDIITFQFPEHGASVVRLRKTDDYAYSTR